MFGRSIALSLMSKSLIKLIDASLIPAAIMICGKVAGLWLANVIFNLEWGIDTQPNNFFSVHIVYKTLEDQTTAASYSNLVMYLFVFIGFLVVLIRALYFHSSHISPRVIARLATHNLLNLISDSFEIYHKASVWLVMLWLSLLALIINVLLRRAYTWTAALAFFCTIIATIILFRDISREIEMSRKNIHKLAESG